MSLGVEHVGHLAMTSPGIGFINRDGSPLRPGAFRVGRFDIMGRPPARVGCRAPQEHQPRRHRHFPAQEQSQGLKKKGKTATFPRPRHRHAQTGVRGNCCPAPPLSKRHSLEEVQMSPALDAGVTGRAKFAALRKAKALALLKIQLQ